ncbi:Pantothenate kinase type III, CoaX-like [hydrothermal vent metagenome]|uniref:Type III pantothenate kinase n=1 Tax=hydrothermal vent metagenome TaxID=652676 RepID=A0A3B1DFB3_9ZZZZ
MLLAVDIGNTTISLAVLKGQRVVGRFFVETSPQKSKIPRIVTQTLKDIDKQNLLIDKAVLCSVVPHVSSLVCQAIQKQWKIKISVIGKDIYVPIKNNYRKPEQIGQDRLVVAYAAQKLYGTPAVVIDFGTAITFDAISAKGIYEGGIIIPGIRMSTESLFQKTSLLPSISPTQLPKHFIGKDTEEGILSGIFYGYGTMCNGLIDMFQKKYKGKAKVIVTGGHTHLMKKFIHKNITKIDKDLVFQGMRLLVEVGLKI